MRIGALVEWALAAAAMLAVVAAGTFVAREYRSVAGVIPMDVSAVAAPGPLIAAPATIPPAAVSVPVLLLPGGRELRVGEPLSAIVERLGRDAEVAPPAVERAPNGERVTRTYELAEVRFRLVFEQFADNGEPRLAAIYR
jgi:hypothetical protein